MLMWAVRRQARALASTGTRALADAANELKKTELHSFHVEQGAQMVDFNGYSMPLAYKDSILESARHCRKGASIFDVSHMCGVSFKGKDAIDFVEGLCVADFKNLETGNGVLTVFTNEEGGIVDDSVVSRIADDHLYLVVNAGCREKDLDHFKNHLERAKKEGKQVDMHVHDENNIIALQGPKAQEALQAITDVDVSKLYFGMVGTIEAGGALCWASRSGYTGEDGFEVALPREKAKAFVQGLLNHGEVKMAGLGARDSLRLEAGLCLYGNDIDESTSPVEAGLTWTVGKRRREKYDFLGGETIRRHIEEGTRRRRAGLVVTSGAPARAHAKITDGEGKEVGEITSGGHSPNLNKGIAMGYIDKPLNKSGNTLGVVVRSRKGSAETVKMPFVEAKYHRPA